jgi:hypothetical protein
VVVVLTNVATRGAVAARRVNKLNGLSRKYPGRAGGCPPALPGYLGSIGGPAAILAQESIKSVKVLDYPELGMESVWQIEVRNFPAFILIDDKGNDFFGQSK